MRFNPFRTVILLWVIYYLELELICPQNGTTAVLKGVKAKIKAKVDVSISRLKSRTRF